jgi:hypothetical protein
MNVKVISVSRAAVAAALLILAAGTVVATPASPQAKPGQAAVLEYKMPAGRSLTYQGKSEGSQAMEIQGQSIDSSSTGSSTFSFKSKGAKDKNLLLAVTVDDMASSMNGPQGDVSPDMSSVKGKSFDMVLSPLGNEVDVSAAEALTFTAAEGTGNISSSFKAFFPDLPGKPVKVGDTWNSSDSVEEKSSAQTMKTEIQNVHTLEGFETVDGVDCARISTQFTGTITGTGSQGGADLTFSGTTKGKNVWFFAVKEGYLVKTTSESTSEISVDVSAMGMTIPVTATSKSEFSLTGKQ